MKTVCPLPLSLSPPLKNLCVEQTVHVTDRLDPAPQVASTASGEGFATPTEI